MPFVEPAIPVAQSSVTVKAPHADSILQTICFISSALPPRIIPSCSYFLFNHKIKRLLSACVLGADYSTQLCFPWWLMPPPSGYAPPALKVQGGVTHG